MRLHYYRFPENVSEEVRLQNGCAIVLKNGDKTYKESIPDDKRELVDYVDDIVEGISITYAKQLLKKYGGAAWTYHCERDGTVFESTPITLSGNNSKFRYNVHL